MYKFDFVDTVLGAFSIKPKALTGFLQFYRVNIPTIKFCVFSIHDNILTFKIYPKNLDFWDYLEGNTPSYLYLNFTRLI